MFWRRKEKILPPRIDEASVMPSMCCKVVVCCDKCCSAVTEWKCLRPLRNPINAPKNHGARSRRLTTFRNKAAIYTLKFGKYAVMGFDVDAKRFIAQ